MSKIVSIIICTYNQADGLLDTLKGFERILVPPELDCELIIVDNNSKDHTKEVIYHFKSLSQFKIRYIFEGEQGLSHARNAGIREANGELIIFTDDDVTPESNWLVEIVNGFKAYNADCVGGRIFPVWPIKRPEWLGKRIEGNLALLDHGDNAFQVKNTKRLLFGANISFSRDIFDKVGLFNTSLGRKGTKLYSHEEVDLFKRILQSGGKIIYQPKAVVYHKISRSRVKKSYFRKWHFDDGECGAFYDPHLCNTVLGIPKYYPHLLISCFEFFMEVLFPREKTTVFYKELRICYLIGYIYGRIKQLKLASPGYQNVSKPNSSVVPESSTQILPSNIDAT